MQLLSNLRIAAATFGEDNAHFQELKEMVFEHLRLMSQPSASPSPASTPQSTSPANGVSPSVAAHDGGERTVYNLAFRPRPSS